MLPITGQENPNTPKIDEVSTIKALELINSEDKLVAAAVASFCFLVTSNFSSGLPAASHVPQHKIAFEVPSI